MNGRSSVFTSQVCCFFSPSRFPNPDPPPRPAARDPLPATKDRKDVVNGLGSWSASYCQFSNVQLLTPCAGLSLGLAIPPHALTHRSTTCYRGGGGALMSPSPRRRPNMLTASCKKLQTTSGGLSRYRSLLDRKKAVSTPIVSPPLYQLKTKPHQPTSTQPNLSNSILP